jgi:hypothetical protein
LNDLLNKEKNENKKPKTDIDMNQLLLNAFLDYGHLATLDEKGDEVKDKSKLV